MVTKPAKPLVVVTGGAGFIGSHLTDALVSQGFAVTVIDNLSAGRRASVNPRAKLIVADIRDRVSIQPSFRGAQTVFHLAAVPRAPYSIDQPEETNAVNVDGTLNVLLAAREAKVRRLIYSASSSAYGEQTALPLAENLPPMPRHPYGIQKYVGELYCRVFSEIYALETVCLRYFNVYGPRQDPTHPYAGVLGRFLLLRRRGEPLTIIGDGRQTRDFTNVADAVRANLLAMTSSKVGRGEVINIGGGRNFSIKQIADLVGGPVNYLSARPEARDSLADIRLAKALLDWEPQVAFATGLAELKKYIDDLPQ